MDLLEAKTLAIRHMTEHGLIEKGWTFKWGYGKNQFGLCRFREKSLTFSIPLVEVNDLEPVTDVILHEIAHALVGNAAGHGPVWVSKARELGCNGKRTYDETEVVSTPGKYSLVCAVHGVRRQVYRRTKTAKSCSQCSPVFDRRYLLTLVEN